MEKILGPKTVEILNEVSKPLVVTGYWATWSTCGSPKLIVWKAKKEDEGARLCAMMMLINWDLTCCCGACYGPNSHFTDYLTEEQIKSLGFQIPLT